MCWIYRCLSYPGSISFYLLLGLNNAWSVLWCTCLQAIGLVISKNSENLGTSTPIPPSSLGVRCSPSIAPVLHIRPSLSCIITFPASLLFFSPQFNGLVQRVLSFYSQLSYLVLHLGCVSQCHRVPVCSVASSVLFRRIRIILSADVKAGVMLTLSRHQVIPKTSFWFQKCSFQYRHRDECGVLSTVFALVLPLCSTPSSSISGSTELLLCMLLARGSRTPVILLTVPALLLLYRGRVTPWTTSGFWWLIVLKKTKQKKKPVCETTGHASLLSSSSQVKSCSLHWRISQR